MRNPICDTIFVMDPQFNVIGILSNNGAFPDAPFFDDTYIQELATGAETYEFSTYSNAITSEILQLGNYIVFKYGNKYKLFQIMDNDDEHKESQIITCYCEMAGLELLTDYCEPFSIEGNVQLFFNTVLQDTNWQLGGFSESLATNIQQVKIEKYTNVYKVIQENIETYGNIEIEFRVGFNGNAVTGFYIDVYENGYRGSKTYKRFEYGENVEGIKRNRNMYDFASAMIGTGKDGLTFKDIEWKIADGKPADKPKGQDFIVDLGANERFNKRGKYIKSLYESDDTNPQDLLLHSWERLQEVKEPKFDYEVDLALTDTEFEEISIGDTNYVIDNDYNPPILLECRVGKLEISLTDSSKNKCTLSNYKEVISKIKNINNSNSQFMGISRGGYLNFNLITDGFDIRVKNKLINEKGEEYYLNIKNSKAEDFLIDKANSHTSVTQSFVIDYVNNHIYSAQVEDNKTTGNLILTKMSLTGNILEKMYLKNFGHAGQIGVSHENGKVYLWCECDGALHSNGMNYGTKICKFEFKNNTTVNGHAGKVFDLVPGMIRVSVAVNQETNRLGVRYMDNNGMCYVSVYEYNSIITGNPKLLSTITIPKVIHSNNQPNQGFAVVGDFLYYFTGYGYDQTNNVNNSKLHCFDLKGKKIYEYLITHRLDMIMREPEGVFIRQISETEHEIYLGFASGNAGARKFNIFKYRIVADDSYEFRGNFIHLNGFTCPIEECVIRTGFDGTLNRNAFLLLTPNNSNKFNVANFINSKFIINGNVYEPIENDSIIAEISELKNNIKLNILTSNSPNNGMDGKTPEIGDNGNWVVGGVDTGKPSQGQDGQPGKDGLDGKPGEQGPPGQDAVTYYTWIRYADDQYGNGISNSPNGKKYIGFAYNKTTPLESNTPSDYLWSLIKGTDGVPGKPGQDGTTYYTWIKYSDYSDGNPCYDMPSNATRYIGIAINKTTPTESSDYRQYTWSKFRGDDGVPGKPGQDGSDGVSPLNATITGQSLMKYIDKNTAPIPATVTLKCKVAKGSNEITGACSYQWQVYYNNYWTTISNSYSTNIAYNSYYFSSQDILQIRVIIGYGSESITLEHSITKVYDNKYITQQEIFDKLCENGNEFIYIDPATGKIYVNATYIKTGQFVADLIKGGILTLGGTGDNGLGDYGQLRILDHQGTTELARLSGGEMWLDTLTCGNIIAENIDVSALENSKMPTKLDSNVTVYVDATISDEQSSNVFTDDAVFNSLQGAIDSIPTNLNSFNATIKLNTNVNEDVEIRGMSGGGVYIFLCKKNIYGNVHIVNNSARISVYGGTSSSDTTTPYGIIKPSEFVNITSRMFSICVVASPNTFLRYLNVYGKKDSSNTDLYYAIGVIDMSAAYIGNVKVTGSDNAIRAGSLGRIYVTETEGKVNNYAFRAVSGGDIRLNSTGQVGGGTNTSAAGGSTIVYSSTGVTFDGSSSVGTNDNVTTVTKSVTLKSNLGDTYRSTVYNSWKKDNTVRQGNYGYGDCNGVWFFGTQFTSLKGKTISKVVLKIKRNSGGTSGGVSHVIKMHNYSSRPGGNPSYLSGWSQTASISTGETKTITITNSTVLSAIKNGTMKGFGLQSSYSKSNYSVCSGTITAIITYKE